MHSWNSCRVKLCLICHILSYLKSLCLRVYLQNVMNISSAAIFYTSWDVPSLNMVDAFEIGIVLNLIRGLKMSYDTFYCRTEHVNKNVKYDCWSKSEMPHLDHPGSKNIIMFQKHLVLCLYISWPLLSPSPHFEVVQRQFPPYKLFLTSWATFQWVVPAIDNILKQYCFIWKTPNLPLEYQPVEVSYLSLLDFQGIRSPVRKFLYLVNPLVVQMMIAVSKNRWS